MNNSYIIHTQEPMAHVVVGLFIIMVVLTMLLAGMMNELYHILFYLCEYLLDSPECFTCMYLFGAATIGGFLFTMFCELSDKVDNLFTNLKLQVKEKDDMIAQLTRTINELQSPIKTLINLCKNTLVEESKQVQGKEYTVWRHKEMVRAELKARKIDSDTIDMWLEYIDEYY